MPYPRTEESEQDFLKRFMASPEAISDFPDEAQRAAVAHSMWRRRALNSNDPDVVPKVYTARHLEPGLVHYEYMGEIDPETKKPRGATFLVRKELLDKMRHSFIGKPVVNLQHKEVPDNLTKEQYAEWFRNNADGIIIASYYNPEDGWDYVDFVAWDPMLKATAESGKFSVSCSWEPTATDEKAGTYHSLPYDAEVTDGVGEHLAVVMNPRYEGAKIFLNSKGGESMSKILDWLKFNRKGKVVNATDADLERKVKVGDEEVSLKNLVDGYKAEEAEKKAIAQAGAAAAAPEQEELKEDDLIEFDGSKVPLKNLMDTYSSRSARLKAAAEEEAAKKAKEDKEKADNAAREAEETAKAEKAKNEAAHAAHKEAPVPDTCKLCNAEKDAATAEAERVRLENEAAAAKAHEGHTKETPAENCALCEKLKNQKPEPTEEEKRVEEIKQKHFEELRNAAMRRAGSVETVDNSLEAKYQRGKKLY